jgi:hypothetical protein
MSAAAVSNSVSIMLLPPAISVSPSVIVAPIVISVIAIISVITIVPAIVSAPVIIVAAIVVATRRRNCQRCQQANSNGFDCDFCHKSSGGSLFNFNYEYGKGRAIR